jgi:hypothetical protein
MLAALSRMSALCQLPGPNAIDKRWLGRRLFGGYSNAQSAALEIRFVADPLRLGGTEPFNG